MERGCTLVIPVVTFLGTMLNNLGQGDRKVQEDRGRRVQVKKVI
jgi:hypothetical protein